MDLKLLDRVVTTLQSNMPLKEKDVLTLTLVDTGTHADLFDW